MVHAPMITLGVLCIGVVACQWAVEHTWLRHFGVAFSVIIFGAVASNAGLIPTGAAPVAVYEGVFAYLAPMSIFWLLLRVDLKQVFGSGLPLLGVFLIGAAGTTAGAVLGLWLVGPDGLGDLRGAVAGMFVGTYVGGSVNFNAIALHYGVVERPGLFAGAVVIDNIMTTVWMVATLAIPRWLDGAPKADTSTEDPAPIVDRDEETFGPAEAALMVGLALFAKWSSDALAEVMATFGVDVPSILLLTVFALVLAQLRPVRALRGATVLGMLCVYLFLAVIGAYCDIAALGELGRLAPRLALLAGCTVSVHGLASFVGARVLKIDATTAAVASQANIGGGTTALALARSLGRPDLVLPAILMGSLGTALGTFLGFYVAGFIGGS